LHYRFSFRLQDPDEMAVRRRPYLKPAEVWTTRESAMFSAFSDKAGRRVFTGKPVHYIDQLGMRGTGWIAEFLYRMSIGELIPT
jgi:hypothetical protein